MVTRAFFIPNVCSASFLLHSAWNNIPIILSLLGNHLFSFRNVRYILPLLIFTSNMHFCESNSLFLKRMLACMLYSLLVFGQLYSYLECLVSRKRYTNVLAVHSSSFFDCGWCKGWYLNSSSHLCSAGVRVFFLSFFFWMLTFVLLAV